MDNLWFAVEEHGSREWNVQSVKGLLHPSEGFDSIRDKDKVVGVCM